MHLSDFGRERTMAGQRELANAMRVLVKRDTPEIAEALEGADDSTFLEPLLFTYFAEPESKVGLPQILFGAVAPAMRPDGIEIWVDERGRAFVPRIGTFVTDQRETSLILAWDRTGDTYELTGDSRAIPFRLEPSLFVPGTAIELVQFEDPLTLTRFVDTNGARARVEIDGRIDRHLHHIARGLGRIAEVKPDYCQEILRVTRRLVCFRHDNVNSFATINAHGTAFFNARDDHDEIFFVDELAHQCGHIVFNAMTVARRDFFDTNPDGPLNAIAPREVDGRTIYDAFHGLYTEHSMTGVLREVDERGLYGGRQAHELFGRLSFIARKHRVDLRNLSGDGIFTPLGRQMYDYFERAFREVFDARRELFETDMTGQPYNFDFPRFARLNPMTYRTPFLSTMAAE